MTPEEILKDILPDSTVIKVNGVDITLASAAPPKAIFDAEVELRKRTGVKYELFMSRKGDQNKLRIKLQSLRGVKV